MSLRSIVKKATGQDLYACHACNDCEVGGHEDMDIPLASLVQLVILNDDEALHCRTLWSDSVLNAARGACRRGLDLHAMILVLREEAGRRAEK